MGGRILLLEPYDELADVITELLDHLNYTVDVVKSGSLDEEGLRTKDYNCVFINLDQGRDLWRDFGLQLATLASGLGLPVVMIPDHETADQRLEALGWLRLEKPFTLNRLANVITQAVERRRMTPESSA